ncbi:MAG: hypothetical protein ACREVY_01385 [Gammaproteobacteria bacterium]
MTALRIMFWFFFVFFVAAIVVALVVVPLKVYFGIALPKEYEFIVWGPLPFLVAVLYVRRMSREGKFDSWRG